jgi:CheY-like chemotaxis protein
MTLPQTQAAASVDTRTILVVDDDPSLLGLLSVSLEEAGFTVLKGTSSQKALEACRRHEGPIHLVIADIMLPPSNQLSLGQKGKGQRPNTDGLDLVRQLKAIRPETLVMLMSGQSEEALKNLDAMKDFLKEGCPFLRKPFSVGTMVRLVRETLG